MTELQNLEHKIAQLPNEFKIKLEGYVDTLLAEAWEPKKEAAQFGDGVELGSNEINGPLDEFKAYSY